jgi:uncharacterized phage protein (TIGR02218 family)
LAIDMKTPWYETSPGATAALLLSGQFVDVDCYTFKLAGSFLGVSELLYSAGPIDVSVPGSYWSAKGPTFDQDKAKAVAHYKRGLDVDVWQVVVAPRPVNVLTGQAWPDQIGSASWLAAAQAGALDNAEVQVDRAIAAAWPAAGSPALAPTGIVTVFYGRVGELDVGRSQAVVTVYSHLKVLANPLPRNLFQASCTHTLFDAGCTLNAASFAVNGTVAGLGATGNVFTSAIAAPPGSGTYALGRVTMTSGASAGLSRTVRSWTAGAPGTFTLIAPFTLGIAPGDSFTAYAGCDKQFGTCGRFANQLNYGGCLSIPVPETAV